MIPLCHSGIKHELQKVIIPVTLPEAMIFRFLQSYQKPAVSEISMISNYYQAHEDNTLSKIIFEGTWEI